MIRWSWVFIAVYFFHPCLALYEGSIVQSKKRMHFDRLASTLFKDKDINAPDRDGLTPFMRLFCKQEEGMPNKDFSGDFIRYLVEIAGAHVNHVDNRGNSALYYAIHHDWHSIPALIESGANLHKDGKNESCNILEEIFLSIDESLNAPPFSREIVYKNAVACAVKFLARKGYRISDYTSAQFFRIAYTLACDYKVTEPLQHLIEVGAYLGQKKEMYTNSLGSLGLRWAKDYCDTPASKMIRETVIARDQLLMSLKADATSYFSRLPSDLVLITKNYYLYISENQKVLDEINTIRLSK